MKDVENLSGLGTLHTTKEVLIAEQVPYNLKVKQQSMDVRSGARAPGLFVTTGTVTAPAHYQRADQLILTLEDGRRRLRFEFEGGPDGSIIPNEWLS